MHQRHVMKAAIGTIGAALAALFGLCVLSMACACGGGQAPDETGSAPGITGIASTNGGESCEQLFGELAVSVAPVTVYGLRSLPEGWSVAAQWWPAITLEDPSLYEGDMRPNPLVSGAGAGEPEIQVVLEHTGGWLVVVENFRGDVGEAPGDSIGDVAGNEARLYQVNGGILVQWSDAGRWYGVFGRRVPQQVVVQTALAMRPVDPS